MANNENTTANSNDNIRNPDEIVDATYNLKGEDYTVKLKGNWPEDGNTKTYYTAQYPDGFIKTIVYETGKGWLDIDAGETDHAKALGELIEKNFES